MRNQIRTRRPVFGRGEPVVLEIAVETGYAAYTWVVVARDPVTGEDRIAASGWRPRSGTRKPPASATSTISTELAMGGYAVRLYAGKPSTPDDLASFLSSAELARREPVLDAGPGR